MGLAYRWRQGWGRLKVSLNPRALDLAPARVALPDHLWLLFRAMPPGDQWHGLCVLRRLQQAGWQQPDLLAAALLHDLGKAQGRLSLAYRTVIIIANALHTRWVARLALNAPRSWRYSFYVHQHHAALGAAQLRAVGGSELLTNLVAAHEHGGQDNAPLPASQLALLRALVAADNAC